MRLGSVRILEHRSHPARLLNRLLGRKGYGIDEDNPDMETAQASGSLSAEFASERSDQQRRARLDKVITRRGRR